MSEKAGRRDHGSLVELNGKIYKGAVGDLMTHGRFSTLFPSLDLD